MIKVVLSFINSTDLQLRSRSVSQGSPFWPLLIKQKKEQAAGTKDDAGFRMFVHLEFDLISCTKFPNLTLIKI